MASYRSDRISEDIKREISALLKEIKDPRVQGKLLTVVRADVSHDLSYAKVYISDMNGIENAKEAVKGLKSGEGFIKRELLKRLKLRKSPDLSFIADDSVEYALRLHKQLKDLMGE